MEKTQVSALPITNTDCTTTERSTSDSWRLFLDSESHSTACTAVMCHTPTCPGTSLHVTQAFPMLVLQATNAGVRRTGYKAMPRQFLYLQHCSLNKVHIVDAAIGDYTLDGQLSMRPFSLQI